MTAAASPPLHHGEDESLLESSKVNYGTERTEQHDGGPTPDFRTYRARFWLLAVFSLLCWVHNMQWIIWGPISESMEAAFPGWGPSTVAMMVNWGTIMFVLFFLPLCWFTQRYGLRAGVVTSAAILAAGTVLRCITSTTPAFTILCHLSGIAVGIASPVVLAAPTLIASDWFPVNERTTAMAIMIGAHQMGGVASYLEPLLVRQPGPDVTQADIKQDVMRLIYIGAGIAAALLVAVVIYFPSKPPSPPSISSSEGRVKFLRGLKALGRNKKFMLLLVIYGVFVGPSVMWLTVINYSLLPLGFHQSKAMWVGAAGVVVSSVLPVISGRLNDLWQEHTKTFLIALMTATAAFFYWFLLLSYGVLPVDDWQVYVSAVGGVSCSYATVPLFIEVSIDLAYPVPEILVTGTLIAADNLAGAFFLLLFNIPDAEHLWVTYTLTLVSAVTVLPLVTLKLPKTRTDIDRK